ncbi:WD40 repeat domain-containing protein [Streptomyces sp. NBC_00104]|uniref:WD40 repeat domain-containing protein n=1 Tax=Streptomyces sp. NBC_00104 TaxID=2903621 RepID=UPI00386DC8F9
MAEEAGFSATTLSQAAAGERLPSRAVVQGYARACGGDTGEWETRWKEAEAAVAAALAQDEGDGAAPYRGLARFESDDHELFFGRDRILAELCRLVSVHRFAAVQGASGSGKSSLLRAGFLPRVRKEMAGSVGAVRVFTPGARPAETYGHLLTPAEGEPERWVVVDQFEEVFTLCQDEAERARFIELLLTARDPAFRLRVVIAVRADFCPRCADHPELADALRRAGLAVGPMTADELRDAVVKPALAAGVLVERSLVTRIVEEVLDRPGALPMLSHALLETWRRRKGRMLTTAAYEAAGGLNGAIATTAEEVYGQLSASQAVVARLVLLRLVEPGRGTVDTGRPFTAAELRECRHSETPVVVERLARARLLTVDDEVVRFAHEALITCWPRLHGWVERDRERLRHHRQLTEAVRAWLEHDRDPGTLYRGTRLARAEEMFPGHDSDPALGAVERSFLTAACEAREAERRAAARSTRRSRQLVGAVSAVLAVALVTGLAAWRQHDHNQRQRTEYSARRIAAVADGLRTTDPRAALLLSVAAWRIAPLPETRRALLGSLAQPEQDAFSDAASGRRSQRFLADSGRTLLSVDDHTWQTWNLGTRRTIASGRLPDGEVLAAAPDARLLAIAGKEGSVRLWDTHTGHWAGGEASPPGQEGFAFGASGRSYVVGEADGDHVWLRSIADGRVLFETPKAGPVNVVPSADDRLVAVCPAGKTPQVWELDGRRHAVVVHGSWERAPEVCGEESAVLFGGGGRFAAVSEDEVWVWDVRSGDLVAEIRDPGVRHASFDRNGTFLATAGSSDEIRVWRLSDPAAPALRHSVNNQHLHGGLAWDPGPRVLRYLEGSTVHTLDLTTTVTAAWRASPMDGTLISPNGRVFVTAERVGAGFRFQLLGTEDGRLIRTLPSPSRPLPVSRDGGPAVPGDGAVPQMAFSPDGSRFVYGVTASGGRSAPQRFTVWDLTRDREQSTLDLAGTVSATAVTALAVTSDGRTLFITRTPATGEPGNERWDTTTRRRIDGPDLAGARLALSPREKLVVGDNRVARDDFGRSVALDLVQGEHITALAFSPDGHSLAAGDRTGRAALWDGRLHRRAGILPNVFPRPLGDTPEAVAALALSPDGHTLAVGGEVGTLQLWDTASQQPLGAPLPTPGEPIRSLAFSPDNTTLLVAGSRVPLRRYTVDPSRAVAEICARVGNVDLTRAEWSTYVPDAPYRRVCGRPGRW